ncbi:ABC transporter permease [Azospirillum picis]|uniref:NitT/TauT family transport system permease protein n=1 Tax=Azospirillum picis TaxID=488438 RepID=A0ABU0MMN1_9PROT|nr:ABC transporter permease subunit [Azospirillum picis]MBP2300756.1 NitT/TauT family transport system permease protein [Azospirillum picis]MDQ0534725.1 NitT/TauT family transport system permease protein [Azospirillum picis]
MSVNDTAAALPAADGEALPSRDRLPRQAVRFGAVALLWLAAAGVTALWPDADEWERTGEFASLLAVAAGILAVAASLAAPLTAAPGGTARPAPRSRLSHAAGRLADSMPWLAVLALALIGWEVLTAKLNLLPRPFFAPPQALLEVYLDDWPRLLDCFAASLTLLATGYAIGSLLGIVTGVAIGWSRAVGYWVHPVLRLIGPLPATAWLPIAFFAFPTSWSASVFLIALASGVPVTILTWSGVAGVNSAYYDIARTLGASPRFLVTKVAVPAAMPHVFVGLFMGLGASFAVLVVAEMLGVKSGIGWYLQWAQGWAAYANMYAALLVMALVCSGLVTLLFRVRDRLLAWQKGMLKW